MWSESVTWGWERGIKRGCISQRVKCHTCCLVYFAAVPAPWARYFTNKTVINTLIAERLQLTIVKWPASSGT